MITGVLNFSFSNMPINLAEYRGTAIVFNNCKFFNRLQYKKVFESPFSQMYFFIRYCYLPCNIGIVVPLFMLLAALTHLKAKVHNAVGFCTISCYMHLLKDSQLAVWSFLDIT